LAKAIGDEEHAHSPVEKTAHTEVIENTASPRLQEQARDREVQI
tara:strand:- start:253 stop:384 length:132 start_codon:yes stop_codon:yes gene_type:complete